MANKNPGSRGAEKKGMSGSKKGEEKMVAEAKPKKIMTQPLPQILDEIEDSIRLADEAAANARQAADEARRAGERAASEAARVAAEKIAKVEQMARDGLKLGELIIAALRDSNIALEKKLASSK